MKKRKNVKLIKIQQKIKLQLKINKTFNRKKKYKKKMKINMKKEEIKRIRKLNLKIKLLEMNQNKKENY